MRYLVALIIGIGVLFGVNFFADLFSMPRPWGSLLMGAIVGITMVLVLLIWETVKPSHRDAAPAKPAMSDEERANARAERRTRLAAEAGVSLEGIDGASAKPGTSGTDPKVPEIGESEPSGPEPSEAEPNESESAVEEPDTLDADEFDEEATGSSLESPPTGEPGISVDALKGEEPEADPSAEPSDSADETTTGEPNSKN